MLLCTTKKQNFVAYSNVAAKYISMASIALEMLSVPFRFLLYDIGIDVPTIMWMYCNNQAAIFIANNLIFHMHTINIQVD